MNPVITYLANTIFILFIIFCIWFIICSLKYGYKPSDDLTGQQSERQKKNDDYNTDYYP